MIGDSISMLSTGGFVLRHFCVQAIRYAFWPEFVGCMGMREYRWLMQKIVKQENQNQKLAAILEKSSEIIADLVILELRY